jgi:serine/threonine-protein kinase
MKRCPACQLEYRDGSRTHCLVDGAVLAEAEDPRIGRLVSGRYAIERPLGTGGMATVYRGDEIASGRVVAIKVMHDGLREDESLRERFRREARNASAIAHENVVEVLDAGETEDGHPFLVMELLEGETLRDLMRRGPLSREDVVELGVQIARGLARAHDLGIVHRDLKPENVFLVAREGQRLAKLVDFGIARARGDRRLTEAGTILGTPAYLAPERVRGADSDPAGDLYSLGVLLFEMVTGQLPFHSESLQGYLFHHLETVPPRPSSIVATCPPALESLVLRLLAKAKRERPVDAHQVVRELEAMRSPATRALVDRVSVTSATHPHGVPAVSWPSEAPRSAVSAGFDRWQRRALLLDGIVRRAWSGRTAPEDVRRGVEQLEQAAVRLESLRAERAVQQTKLDAVGARSRETRERLGRAMHALGRDLSEARESLERLRAELARRELEVSDLEFQIQAMRTNLGETEVQAEASRAQAERTLLDTGREIEVVRERMGRAAQVVIDAVRAQPGGAELLEGVD